MKDYATLRAEAEAAWQGLLTAPVPRITVGTSYSALARGALGTLAAIREELSARHLKAVVGISGGLGAAYAEPLVDIAFPGEPRLVYASLTPERVPALMAQVVAQGQHQSRWALGVLGDESFGEMPSLFSLPFFRGQTRRLSATYGIIDPENIDHYLAHGGYEALYQALTQLTPEEINQELDRAGLLGRGGAYFPTGRKWEFLRTAQGQRKWMLCNADEGDPGAYVNRATLESDPHSLLEGIIIGCYATGSHKGYIYLRAEYPQAAQRLQVALKQAYEWGLLGENILGTGFSCDLELVVGAGAYVCGEETGMIASLQDERGMPRIKPPFPAQAGLFWEPSNVNNVETFANVPLILRSGTDWYASLGVEGMRGTKLFSLSGDIQRAGVIEVPFGTPLRQVVEGMGGGVPGGRRLKAVQPGGPLGGFVPAMMLDIPLERNAFAEAGALLGSGGLVLIDETACMVDITRPLLAFVQDESCGRCTSCRIGTMRLVDLAERIAAGQGRPADLEIIDFLDRVLKDSNCVHGQLGATAAVTSLRHFREEWEAHIRQKRCPARVCEGLIQYVIAPQRYAEVAEYAAVCPTSAIVERHGEYEIVQERCIKCGACREACPPGVVLIRDAFERVAARPEQPMPLPLPAR